MSLRSSVLALVLLLPAAGSAQEPPAPAPTGVTAPVAGEGAAVARAGSQASAQAPESTPVPLEPLGFDYDAAGRRDPFISLLRRGSDVHGAAEGTRPPGLAGLEASEVVLKGTMQSRGGYVAILQGADAKTYIVRQGDRLFDGAVRSISDNALVILQQVNDPLSRERQREVRKTIRQMDEAK